MVKSRCIVVFACLISFFLVGCRNIEEQERVNESIVEEENIQDAEVQEGVLEEGEEESMKVTMEYICRRFNMSESDFEGVDFEDFVDYYNLTYDTIENQSIKYLLRKYKENYGKPRIPDYRVTLSNLESVELTEENVNSIDIVYFSRIEGEEHNFYIFDFEIGQIIVGSGSESMVSHEDIVGEADEQIKEEIVALIEKYNVFTWQTKIKESNNTGIVGTIDSWLLNIKFDDETMYGIYGRGLNDKYAPEDLDLFVEELKALATSSGENILIKY